MIPKTIHLCWLSDDPFPPQIQQYIDTWRRALPDYKIKKWDFTVFPKDKSPWVAQAFDAKKYAFAADYIRNYALCHEGGIYLDSDVEMLRPLDDLLSLPYFLGFENGSGLIDAGVMASEPGNPIFKDLLQYYEGRDFVKPDGSMDLTPLPKIMQQVLGGRYQIAAIDSPADFDPSPGKVCVLPFDYFSPIHQEHRKIESTSRTYAIHRFAAGWQTGWPKVRRRLKLLLGPAIYQRLISLKRLLLGKKGD